jgi:hypothetical protein
MGVSTYSSSDPAMKTCRSTRSYLVTLWALLFVSCGPTVAQSVAVFDFELIDTSLEGAIRGARRVLSPLSWGGPTDALARILAERMRGSLGQPVIIENPTGARSFVVRPTMSTVSSRAPVQANFRFRLQTSTS